MVMLILKHTMQYLKHGCIYALMLGDYASWCIWPSFSFFLTSGMLHQMDQNDIPHDTRHLGVPSGASKMILSLWYVWRKQCTYIASTLIHCPNWPKRDSTWPSSPRSSIRYIHASKMIYEPMVRLTQMVHLSCTHSDTSPNGPKRDSAWPMHLGVAFGACKTNPSLWYVQHK
jgi:hypothetical protein